MTCRLPAGFQLSVTPLLTKMITATEHMSQGLSEPSITATELTASHRKHKYTRLKRLIRTARGSSRSSQGIDWSIANGMDIVNMSLGTTSDSQILHDAMDKAYEQGVLLVAASGNDGNGKPVNYPAAYSGVVAVSATNEKNQLASFSTTGDEVEFSAPGTNITSTYLNQFYATGSGTSQATPHAAPCLLC